MEPLMLTDGQMLFPLMILPAWISQSSGTFQVFQGNSSPLYPGHFLSFSPAPLCTSLLQDHVNHRISTQKSQHEGHFTACD